MLRYRAVKCRVVDIDRGCEMARALIDISKLPEYKCIERGYVTQMPQDLVDPDSGSVKPGREGELTNYITVVVFADRGVGPERLWAMAKDLYEGGYRDFFDLCKLKDKSIDEIRDFLRELGAISPRRDAPELREVARIICDKYGGDPRNMVKGVTVAKFKDWVRELPILRGEVVSTLLLRLLCEYGLACVLDPENIDMPPDKPTACFTTQSGILPCYKDIYICKRQPPHRLKEDIKRAWRDVYNKCLRGTNIYIADLHFTILVVDRVVGSDPECYRSRGALEECFKRRAGKCTQPKTT